MTRFLSNKPIYNH